MSHNEETMNSTRWGDLIAAIFLIAALMVGAYRLVATEWIDDLALIQTVTLFGVVAGLGLGQSIFSRRTVNLFVLVYGLFTIAWQIGMLAGKGILWMERLQSIAGRLTRSLGQVIRQQDVTDPILFITVMAILFWVLSIHAGYSLTRRGNGWIATMPTGAALFIIHINDKFWPFRAWFLGIYLVLALMVISRMAYLRMREEWQRTRTRVPAYIGLDLSRAALLAVVPLILIAWTAPALAVALPAAQDNWQSLTVPIRERFDNLFASLQATVGLVGDYYGDTLPLGRGNELTDAIVMIVEAPFFKPASARYYWHARTFDRYTSEGWESTFKETVEITTDLFDLELAENEFRWTTELTFMPNIPLRTLHTVPQAYAISRPGEAQLIQNPDGSLEISALFADPFLRPGEVYTVRSAITDATIKELRESGSVYPDWITERYLQLPENISDRTRELASRITDEYDNNYDKVNAITEYLRDNITYNERIAAPPVGQERVDWLLFDYQQGFCNYYATAEVVLLRTLGIPARLSVGYAQGERELESDTGAVPTRQPGLNEDDLENFTSETSKYIVRQRDLHAWPEVYFPEIGWVEFEPTANQLPIFRLTGFQQTNPSGGALEEDERDPSTLPDSESLAENQDNLLEGLVIPEPETTVVGIILRVVLFLTGVLVSILALRGLRKRLPPEPLPVQLESRMRKMGLKPPRFLERWARYASLPALTRSYLEINRALSRLGSHPPIAATPSERTQKLATILPPASDPAHMLLTEYQAQIYSPYPANEEGARSAGLQVRNLSILAWFNRLLKRWQEPEN